MSKMLTISIAAYNVEKTLPKLMDTLLAIKERDKIEILIVNDGSTDHTLELARSYERDNPDCVKVIDKQNGGHGSTINAGIKTAFGKYFRPVDGDDWVDTENVDKLIERLENLDSDLILTNFYRCYETGNGLNNCQYELGPSYGLKDGKIYRFKDIVADLSPMRYHTTIYKTELLRANGITLSERCFYVDTELNLLPLPYVTDITYFDFPVYCYRLGYNEQSVSRLSRQKHIEDSRRVAERLLKFYRDNKSELTPGLKKYLKNGVRGICVWHYIGLCYFERNNVNKRQIIDFDKYVYSNDPGVYQAMVWDIRNSGKRYSFLILMMRASGYLLYPLAVKLLG